MARQLILIPKTKYEHLLKSIEDKNHQQKGGRSEENESEVDSVIPEQPASKGEQQQHNNETTEPEVKPSMYVEKPLSEMTFNRRKGTKRHIQSRKIDSRKQTWINYSI